MPLELATWTFAHRRLECEQLGARLQALDGIGRLHQEVPIRVPLDRLRENGLK